MNAFLRWCSVPHIRQQMADVGHPHANTFLRWCQFNLVGLTGMVVQLAALALFVRWMPEHYLLATAAALEITLLHNFLWHSRYTWPDRSISQVSAKNRREPGAPARMVQANVRQLLRFHLSNGAVSLAGNLVLMRVLVDEAHMPVLAANGVAIVCCSIVNFALSDQWAFAASRRP